PHDRRRGTRGACGKGPLPHRRSGPFPWAGGGGGRYPSSSTSAIGAAWVRVLTRHSSTRPSAVSTGPSSVLLARISPSVTTRNVPSNSGIFGIAFELAVEAAPIAARFANDWNGLDPP